MSIFRRTDNMIVLVFLVITAMYGYFAQKMPYFGRGIIGAAFFPKILTVTMLLLCVAFFAVSIFLPSEEESQEDEPVKPNKLNMELVFKPMAVVVLIGAYAVGLFSVGFKISTFLFFLLMLLLYGERRWVHLFLIPLVVTISFNFIFRILFKLPLRDFLMF